MPVRTCIGCRRTAAQETLLRMARDKSGRVAVITGRRWGRGAYVCPEFGCIQRAVKPRALQRAFKRPVSRPVGAMELADMAIETVRHRIQSQAPSGAQGAEGGSRRNLQRMLDSLLGSVPGDRLRGGAGGCQKWRVTE